jgi:hypothetical protein
MPDRIYTSVHGLEPVLVQPVMDLVAGDSCVTQLSPSDHAMLTFGHLGYRPINRTSSSGGSGATNSNFGGDGAMLAAQSARGCGRGYACVTAMVQVAVKVWPGSTTGRSLPERRAFVGAVIGSKQMNSAPGGE